MTTEQIENWFTYHRPSDTDQLAYQAIRKTAKEMAYMINSVCPESADKSDAMRKLRECVMIANASIACGGK